MEPSELQPDHLPRLDRILIRGIPCDIQCGQLIPNMGEAMGSWRLLATIGLAVLFTTPLLGVDAKTQDLYQSTCRGCHGANGKASVIGRKLGAKDFSDPEVVKMSKSDLEKIVTIGRSKMPPYKGKLTDDQIKALVKYIRELK